MRNRDELAQAKIAVARYLARWDVTGHQRACLRGMLAALSWIEDAPGSLSIDNDALALQKLVSGVEVQVCANAKMPDLPMGPLAPKNKLLDAPKKVLTS